MYFSLTVDLDTFAPSGYGTADSCRRCEREREHQTGCQTKNGGAAETLDSDVTRRSRLTGDGAPSERRENQARTIAYEILRISRLINKVC